MLDEVEKSLESAKGQLDYIEKVNFGLYNHIQRLDQELKEVTWNFFAKWSGGVVSRPSFD